MNGQVIEVKDGLIGRIRVAQTSDNVTRVVLEIKSGATFWDDLDEANHRLVIEVRDHETVPQSQPTLQPTNPPATESTKNLAAPVTPSTNESGATPKFRVVLDAGHGGWDLGTVGRGGLIEKTLVLEVAQRLGKMLETKLGAEVTYTRGDDNYVPLEQRAEIANKAKADLFISVHANYSTLETARGVETYYSSFFSPPEAREIEFRENATAQSVDHAKLSGAQLKSKVEQSRRLAASVQSALYGTLVSQNKGIRNRGVKEASFVVLSGTEMPSILAEISFVSSPADEERLQSEDYREQIAEALFKGIEHYASNAKGVKIASASGQPSGR
jgi:N-acetylmuramoyl-L-alanine amidase